MALPKIVPVLTKSALIVTLATTIQACGGPDNGEEGDFDHDGSGIFDDDRCEADFAANPQTIFESPHAADTGFPVGEDADENYPCVTLNQNALAVDGEELLFCQNGSRSSTLIEEDIGLGYVTQIFQDTANATFDVRVLLPQTGRGFGIEDMLDQSDDFCEFISDVPAFRTPRVLIDFSVNGAQYSAQQEGRFAGVSHDRGPFSELTTDFGNFATGISRSETVRLSNQSPSRRDETIARALNTANAFVYGR